jgi:hypothetical protein
VKHYIFKLGFLDGFQGFVIAATNMHQTFNKYLIAWEMQHPEPGGTSGIGNKRS